MKFRLREANHYRWHHWFAWYPVRVQHMPYLVWLETVERRVVVDGRERAVIYRLRTP